MPIAVVLDTNFLLLPFQRKLDLEGEVERLLETPHFYVVLGQCLDELREMGSKQRKFSPASRAALALIANKKFVVERGFPGPPDDAILKYCIAKNAIMCTADAALRAKAKKARVKTIYLRGKSHLALA